MTQVGHRFPVAHFCLTASPPTALFFHSDEGRNPSLELALPHVNCR